MPALTPADLPNATFHVKKTSWGGGGFLIQVRHPEDWIMGELRIAIPLGMGECHGAYEVTSSLAEVRGLGPLLYDIAMELAGKRGIMSDRRSVSHDARRVWKFYDSRSDTKKKQLDNPQGWLTPEDDSDDCRQDSAGKNWVESPLSRVNYKNSTPVLDDLRRRGMLRMASTLFLNTSNPNKLREFKRLGLSGIKALRRDLPEPDADPLTVIRSKASQIGPNTIVEDTSLEVEGADVGVNVKWLLDNLDRYEGRKATFRVLLGILREGQVEVYEGRVEGTLVPPRGDGFGFDPVFLPDGASKTLGEAKPDRYNARALAVRAFLRGRPARTLPPLDKWEGDWQGKTALRKPSGGRVASAYLRSKTACIIAAGQWDGHKCLFKNRDRNYTPKVKVYHVLKDGVEILYMKDEITGWCEGINSSGIGIVNSALAVAKDEKEKRLTEEDAEGATLRDGKRVLEALSKTSVDDAVESIKTFDKGLKGHTFVADPDRTVSLEATWEGHDYHIRQLANDKKHVRTNHGQYHQDAGYTEDDGDDYLSSLARRDQAMKVIRGVDSYEQIAPAIYGKRRKDRSDPLNMVKLTDGMKSTSQIVLDLSDLTVYLYLLPDQVEFLGYQNDLPKGRKPKLTLKVMQYTDLDDAGGFEVEEVDHGSKTASVKTATTIPEILGNCGADVTQRAGKVKYKRKRLSPSGLTTWTATGSKGEEYIIRVKPIRKDKRLKQVAKMPVQIACSCPYFRWQGPEHWAVQNEYLYGKPRGTASVPVIKDPLSEHWACKHAIAVLQLVQRYRYAGEGGWDWTGPVVPVSPHELDEGLVKRVARIEVYKPLSEAGPKVEELLSRRTPAWLDRDYPYVSPPGKSGTLAELDYLVSLIPLREKWASFIRAADEDAEGLFMSLCSELGVPCDRRTLDEMVSEALVLITKLKWLYNRPRPYQVAERAGRSDFYVLDSVSAHTPAYPSGHTIQAYLLASRLSELAPQHRGAFMDLAHKISFSRAVAGYHWPSDLTYAKDLYRHIVSPHMPSSVRVANRFRESQG